MKKKMLSLILSLSMLLAVVVSPTGVYAAEEGNNYCDWATITACRDEMKAPTIDGTDSKVFAGWYKGTDFKDALKPSETVSGAYAKFVDSAVLSVKYQITADTKTVSNETNLRLLTTVDSLNYQSVGFDITVGDQTESVISDTVYSTIYGYVDDEQNAYTPAKSFNNTDSLYFMVFELQEIPNSAFDTAITVTPKWTTLDGITVTGTENTIVINDVADNSVTVSATDEKKLVSYDIYGDLSAGSVLSFNIAFNTTEVSAVWVVKNGIWTDENQYYAKSASWSSGVTRAIAVELPDDWEFARVYIQFPAASSTYSATLSNIQIGDSAKVQNTAIGTTNVLDIGGKFTAGSTLSFDIEFNTTENVIVNVLGNGKWDDYMYYERSQTWSTKSTIVVELPHNLEYVQIYIRYASANSSHAFTVSNIQMNDSIPLSKHTTTYQFAFDFAGDLSAGKTLSFDIDFEKEERIAIFLFGRKNNSTSTEYTVLDRTRTRKETIAFELPEDFMAVTVLIRYMTEDGVYTDNLPTISNINIGDSFTVPNPENTQVILCEVAANNASGFTAGSTLSFNVDFANRSDNMGVWVLGNGLWEPADYEYTGRTGNGWAENNRNFTVTVPEGHTLKYIQIYIKYLDTDSVYNDNLVTISDIQITTP